MKRTILWILVIGVASFSTIVLVARALWVTLGGGCVESVMP